MRTKNVYIYTKDTLKDFHFRQADIKKNGIDQRDVFTDVSFENAYQVDIAGGLCGWDEIRMVDANGKEKIYMEEKDDEQIKKEYDEMYPKYKHITPKERKIHEAMYRFGHVYGYWNKMTSKQLSGMLSGCRKQLL